MKKRARRQKNGKNLKTRDGNFKNKFELECFRWAQQKYGKKNVKYEPFTLPYVIEATYTPDLVIEDEKIIFEIKGYFDYAARRKMLAVKKANPEWKIVLVFAKDNKLRRGGKKRYSDWCEEHGFDYIIWNKRDK